MDAPLGTFGSWSRTALKGRGMVGEIQRLKVKEGGRKPTNLVHQRTSVSPFDPETNVSLGGKRFGIGKKESGGSSFAK